MSREQLNMLIVGVVCHAFSGVCMCVVGGGLVAFNIRKANHVYSLVIFNQRVSSLIFRPCEDGLKRCKPVYCDPVLTGKPPPPQ